jgi:hypothetical protein
LTTLSYDLVLIPPGGRVSDELPAPTNLAGLDHLPSIAFNALSHWGICWATWSTAECGGTAHFCWAYRAFPHVCKCGNPGHREDA